MIRSGRAAIIVLALGALVPVAALGQASTNQKALDTLGPAARPHPHARPAHVVRHTTRHAPLHSQPTSGTAARIGKPPTVPPRPPPPPIIAPPAIHVALHPPPPPPAVPVDAHAAGAASTIRDGTRITFGPASAGVNADTDAALHAISARLKAEPTAVTDIDAYAAGSADDPSSPRRLSLERALVARAVLINDGISSTRIYARALGATPAPASDPEPSGPPDRLDITVHDTAAAPAAAAPVKAAGQ